MGYYRPADLSYKQEGTDEWRKSQMLGGVLTPPRGSQFGPIYQISGLLRAQLPRRM